MGEVFLAKALGAGGFEKLVALKVLTQAGETSARYRDSLEREALIGVNLDHDNIVGVLDYGEEAGRHFVVMEFVRGFSLAHLLRHARQTGTRIPVRVAVHVTRLIASALAYVHAQRDSAGTRLGLIHGDVTPSNILLSAGGRIKLTDFGIAALAKELVGAQAVAGKPRYLPPEVRLGAPHTQGADLYALAITLWETLSGRPFPQAATREDLARSAREGPPPLGGDRPDLSAALTRLVLRGCAGQAQDRFDTAKHLLDALDDASPRQVDDADVHRAFVRAEYQDPAFVASFGPLPSTGSLGRTYRLAPHVSAGTDATLSMRHGTAPLRFGMSPAISSDLARTAGDRFALAMASKLRREVRPTVFGDYQTLADALVRGDVDFAWTPPEIFLQVYEHGAGMLALMERGGRVTFHSGLFVREDAEARELRGLRGARAAWVDRHSSSGYLVPYAALLTTLGTDPLPLSQQHFHGSHRAVVDAVANGWADFGATYAHRPRAAAPTETAEASSPAVDPLAFAASGWTELSTESAVAMRPVAILGPIPGDNLSHSPHMPSSLVEELIEVLTSLHASPEGLEALRSVLGATRLVQGDFDLYEPLAKAAQVVCDLEGAHP